MSVTFSCPHCKSTFRVNTRLAGRVLECRLCGEDMRVPGRPTPAPEPVTAWEPEPEPEWRADELREWDRSDPEREPDQEDYRPETVTPMTRSTRLQLALILGASLVGLLIPVGVLMVQHTLHSMNEIQVRVYRNGLTVPSAIRAGYSLLYFALVGQGIIAGVSGYFSVGRPRVGLAPLVLAGALLATAVACVVWLEFQTSLVDQRGGRYAD